MTGKNKTNRLTVFRSNIIHVGNTFVWFWESIVGGVATRKAFRSDVAVVEGI